MASMIGQEHKKKDPHIDAQVSMQVKTEEPLKKGTYIVFSRGEFHKMFFAIVWHLGSDWTEIGTSNSNMYF